MSSAKNGAEKTVRSRTFELVLYPEDPRTAGVLARLDDEKEQYAGILHDKDVDENGELKKPHYHILLTYDNARSLSSIAKRLCVAYNAVEAKDNAKQSMMYLCHRTAKSRNKWQYDTSALFGPLAERAAAVISDSDMRDEPESSRAAALLSIIVAPDGPRTVTQLVAVVVESGLWDVYRRAAYTWHKVLEEAQAADRPTYQAEGWSSVSAAEIAGKALSDAPFGENAQAGFCDRKVAFVEYAQELIDLAAQLKVSDARAARGEHDPLRYVLLRKVELAGGRAVLPPAEFL